MGGYRATNCVAMAESIFSDRDGIFVSVYFGAMIIIWNYPYTPMVLYILAAKLGR